MTGRRVLVAAGALAVIGIIGVAAALNIRSSSGSQPGATATPNEGRSRSLFGGIDNGFSISVNRVERGVTLNGRSYVVLTVTFTSTNRSIWERAYRDDLTLVDGTGGVHRPVIVKGTRCAGWPMTDLAPPSGSAPPIRDQEAVRTGSTFGPVTVCYEDAGGAGESVALVWDPDVGPLGAPVRIPLR